MSEGCVLLFLFIDLICQIGAFGSAFFFSVVTGLREIFSILICLALVLFEISLISNDETKNELFENRGILRVLRCLLIA
jgi:hypothetical protein